MKIHVADFLWPHETLCGRITGDATPTMPLTKFVDQMQRGDTGDLCGACKRAREVRGLYGRRHERRLKRAWGEA